MRFLAAFLLASFLLASSWAQQQVVKSRPKPTDYPSVQEDQKLTLGAAQLSSKQARKAFVSNLRKDYLVVEVGIYPKQEAKISPSDFSLRVKGRDEKIRPADPVTMATTIDQADQKGEDVAVTPFSGIEYSTGPDPNDPDYRRERRDGNYPRGTRITSGVMVDMKSNKKSAKASAGDIQAMSAELREKGVPELTTKAPIAGYLFFPVRSGKAENYELVYETDEGKLVVPLVISAK
jgi:hypothetical protein